MSSWETISGRDPRRYFMIWMCSVPVLVAFFFFLVHHFNAQMYNEFRSLALMIFLHEAPVTSFWQASSGLQWFYTELFTIWLRKGRLPRRPYGTCSHRTVNLTSYLNKDAKRPTVFSIQAWKSSWKSYFLSSFIFCLDDFSLFSCVFFLTLFFFLFFEITPYNDETVSRRVKRPK